MHAMSDGNARRYLTLLVIQVCCALVILYNVRLVFLIMLGSIGTSIVGSIENITQVVLAVAIGQTCYWWRQHKVTIPESYKGLVLGHIVSFCARIGFIFGGALFSLYFLRHVPEIDRGYLALSLPSALLIACLFALYCFTLELERLG